MNVLEQATRFYEFGPFVADPEKGLLLRQGETIAVTPKAFEILMALVQHRGLVLDKDALMRQVWPDTVVEENNLARHISSLRKALDEHATRHQYIATIQGRGYRFVADVRELGAGGHLHDGRLGPPETVGGDRSAPMLGDQVLAADAPPKANLLIPGAPKRRRNLIGAALVLTLAITLGVVAVSRFRAEPRLERAPQRKLWQLTFDPGLAGEPTWSPDGRWMAYSSNRSGNFDIWVQPVGEGNAVRVTTSPAHDWQPDWAPEGNRLVFRSEREGGGLFVVPALGGNERKVSAFGYRPRWSPRGDLILFSSSILPTVTEIPKAYVVGIEGEPPREVLSAFRTGFSAQRLAWHPDGRRISLWGRSRQHEWSFWTVPLAGGAPVKSEVTPAVKRQIEDAEVSLASFQWSPSGRVLYFEGVAGSVRNLWKVEVDPQDLRWVAGPERLTTGTGLETDLAVAPDGKKLAFTSRSEHTRLWSLPFDANLGRTTGAGQAITAAGTEASLPDVASDGKKLVFRAERAGKTELREKSLEDMHEVVRVADGFSRFSPRWSRDGSRLAYRRVRPVDSDPTRLERSLVMLRAGESEEHVLTTPSPSLEAPYDWSADGEWILGSSDRRTPGRMAICLFPLAAAPRAETQMRVLASDPKYNLWQARLSPDGRFISFHAVEAMDAAISTVYVVAASGGAWTRITEGQYWDDKPRWSPDGRTLYFVSNRSGFLNVWGIRFDPALSRPVGEPFRVTAFENPGQMISPYVAQMEIALAADRLVLPIMEVSGGIWILENVER